MACWVWLWVRPTQTNEQTIHSNSRALVCFTATDDDDTDRLFRLRYATQVRMMLHLSCGGCQRAAEPSWMKWAEPADCRVRLFDVVMKLRTPTTRNDNERYSLNVFLSKQTFMHALNYWLATSKKMSFITVLRLIVSLIV